MAASLMGKTSRGRAVIILLPVFSDVLVGRGTEIEKSGCLKSENNYLHPDKNII